MFPGRIGCATLLAKYKEYSDRVREKKVSVRASEYKMIELCCFIREESQVEVKVITFGI